MLDRELRIEVLSALFGITIKHQGQTTGKPLTVDDFHISTILGRDAISDKYIRDFIINEKEFFDPTYDCDFTSLSQSDACSRGDEAYVRPLGWYRMALRVADKYPDGNTWLGPDGWRNYSAPGEWPVSYHGTGLDGANGIITSHYKAGRRDAFGRGIYSTPDLRIAETQYAKTFTSPTTGKTYKVILQNRINPVQREICDRKDYWLVAVPAGTSDKEEKEKVERSIRPYGILIKEVQVAGSYRPITQVGSLTSPVAYTPPKATPTTTPPTAASWIQTSPSATYTRSWIPPPSTNIPPTISSPTISTPPTAASWIQTSPSATYTRSWIPPPSTNIPPTIYSPTISSPTIYSPTIYSPTISSSTISSTISSPTIYSSTISSLIKDVVFICCMVSMLTFIMTLCMSVLYMIYLIVSSVYHIVMWFARWSLFSMIMSYLGFTLNVVITNLTREGADYYTR